MGLEKINSNIEMDFTIFEIFILNLKIFEKSFLV
jgi:hypothetical protein